VPDIPDRHPAKKWDLIISLDVLEHFEVEEAQALLEEMGHKSHRQIHHVNTGEFEFQAFGGDVTHKTALPLDKWTEIAAWIEAETGKPAEIKR
jgi:hypothetical protein